LNFGRCIIIYNLGMDKMNAKGDHGDGTLYGYS
jgi:hypothetical protein